MKMIKLILVMLALALVGCADESDSEREARHKNYAETYYVKETKNSNGDILVVTSGGTILIHEFKTSNDKRCVIVSNHRGTALSCDWN